MLFDQIWGIQIYTGEFIHQKFNDGDNQHFCITRLFVVNSETGVAQKCIVFGTKEIFK